jgi:hypothetical protein
MNRGNCEKNYLTENREVTKTSRSRSHGKKRGQKTKATLPMLLKTNIEKMSTLRFSTMLMKTTELHYSLHDIDENKGERRWARG